MTEPLPAPGCDVSVSQLHLKGPRVENKSTSSHDPVPRENLMLPLWYQGEDSDPHSAIALFREPRIHCLESTKSVAGLEGRE